MTDPGLPPRPRSLHLLESLVKEDEARDQSRAVPDVVIPTEVRNSASPEFYDVDKQKIVKENSSSTTFTEYKMKDTENSSKVKRGNPLAGFKGKKLKKLRSNSSEKNKPKSKNIARPFSADYNQKKRNKLSVKDPKNERAKTATGCKVKNHSSHKGRRERSPQSYSSDTYSTDDEYIKKEKFRSDSSSSQEQREKPELGDFFDADKSAITNKRDSKRSSSSSSSSSDSSSSDDEDDRNTNKEMNGHISRPKEKPVSKTVYTDTNGNQRTTSDLKDYQRTVVVDDYSSTLSSSEDESKRSDDKPNVSKPHKAIKKPKPLLSRKKRQGYKIFQVDPDLYLEGKLHQKYTELEELMACSFVDQKSHMTRHHLYQMELLRDQYHNASHGLPATAPIIPRSLPEDVRNKSSRPTSGKRSQPLSDQVNHDSAYGTLRSVMAAERARKMDKIRTDIYVDRPSSAKRAPQRKKKIEATFKAKRSDTEEEVSDRPSHDSKTDSRASSSPRTLKNGPSVDDHIKYSKNEKLKVWLKEKDKIYRKHVKEEKKKKRNEREKMMNEANEKFDNRIESQKVVKKWMKEKNKEWIKMQKEKRQKEKEEDEWLDSYRKTKSVPGDTLQIRPQSAPDRRPEDVKVDKKNLKGGETSNYVRDQIHIKRDIEEENKQAKRAQEGGPHPPQTKFIYKRPVAGKIKLKIEVRGKSPVAQTSDEPKEDKSGSEEEKIKQTRMSYDEWVKKKISNEDIRKETAKRQKELTKSDPELERIIPALGKKRIEDKLNMRKRIDTGIKKYDDKVNRSFGGGDFDGEAIEDHEIPRNSYRLNSDRTYSGESALSVKQIQRPSTAPSGRRKMPTPKRSTNSPRKAVIPQRVDTVMANDDTCNPYSLPFPPEKGIPAHVAERQRRLFTDQVTNNLDKIEQRALMNAELIKEGVSEADIEAIVHLTENTAYERYNTKMEYEAKIAEKEEDKHPNITELMYSPHKRTDSSESSDENTNNELNEEITRTDQNKPANEHDSQTLSDKDELEKHEKDNENEQIDLKAESNDNSHSHYKTYDNLNELTLDSGNVNSDCSDNHLKEDSDGLNRIVDNLIMFPDAIIPDTETEGGKNPTENINITVVAESETDPSIVGILKESKKIESIPVPETSEEPVQRHITANADILDDADRSGSPEEDLGNSRKRVSFNEQTEIFQSFESSSTDTVTPRNDEIDFETDGLDAQQDSDTEYGDGEDSDDRPDLWKLQGEKLTINIGGIELNPTVFQQDVKENASIGHRGNDDEKKATFITNPDDESRGSD